MIFEDEAPYAEVTRIGRWTHRIVIYQGIMLYGPDNYGWRRLGRRRAEAKAVRELRRFARSHDRAADTRRIGPEKPYDVVNPDGSTTHHSSDAERRSGWAAVYTVPAPLDAAPPPPPPSGGRGARPGTA